MRIGITAMPPENGVIIEKLADGMANVKMYRTPIETQQDDGTVMLTADYQVIKARYTATLARDVIDHLEYYWSRGVAAELSFAKAQKIAKIEKLLSGTDYKVAKLAEGWISEDKYLQLKNRRQEWRDAINAISAAITLEQVEAVAYDSTVPSTD